MIYLGFCEKDHNLDFFLEVPQTHAGESICNICPFFCIFYLHSKTIKDLFGACLPSMRRRGNLGRLRLQLRKIIPAPVTAPSKIFQRLRLWLRLRTKCAESCGSGSGCGSGSASLVLTVHAASPSIGFNLPATWNFSIDCNVDCSGQDLCNKPSYIKFLLNPA